jgi:hypothetical protein
MRKIFIAIVIFGLFSVAFSSFAYEMSSTNYRILDSSINVGGQDIQTSTSYRLKESIGEVATGDATSTSYKLRSGYQPMLETYISLSVSTTSVQMLPSINGLTGGEATGTFSTTVTTDNLAGYSLYVNASTSPALNSGSGSFADYTPVSTDIPDYVWSIPATSSEFGFSPEGSDISQKFKNNGSSACATGTSDTIDSCWYNFSTVPELISRLYYSNHPSGTQTNIKLKAQSGVNNFQLKGVYQAVLITTAFTN